MARLSDLLNKQQPDNGWISMAELDAIEAAQRGQSPTINNGSLANIGPGQGYIQRTGGPSIDLQAQPPGPQDLQLDYASPLDYMGAKGYRLKGDSNRVLLNDGRMVSLSPQADAAKAALRQKQEAADLDMQLKRATLAEKQSGGWKYDKELGMMINDRGETRAMSAVPGVSANRTREAQEAIDITEEAKKYVNTAPGSYLGAAGNIIGKAFGADTDASKAQAKLGVLGGALISKMPKMSGPQSDKDVALYKQMAGNLDDPTQPASAKLAAIEAIQMLNQKYAGADYKPAGGAAPETGVKPFESSKEARYQAWKRSQGM